MEARHVLFELVDAHHAHLEPWQQFLRPATRTRARTKGLRRIADAAPVAAPAEPQPRQDAHLGHSGHRRQPALGQREGIGTSYRKGAGFVKSCCIVLLYYYYYIYIVTFVYSLGNIGIKKKEHGLKKSCGWPGNFEGGACCMN